MITREDAERIAEKLGGIIRSGRRHDLVAVRHEGKHVAQYGIRRGSRQLAHSYIPRQLHITQRQAKDLSECPMSADEYFSVLQAKGFLPDASSDR